MEITDFLAPSQVVINRHASDKVRLLDHLARRAAVALDLPYEMILIALLKREELGSTGTGDGVAVPHARLLGVSKPFGMLARLSEAIDFAAIDGAKGSTPLHVRRESCGTQNRFGTFVARPTLQRHIEH
jgi:nitrogen PTS system EIIA component